MDCQHLLFWMYTVQVVVTLRNKQFLWRTLGQMVQELGKAWVKLFVSILAAHPSPNRLPLESTACLEKALLRHYRDLHEIAPHLANHLASTEAALVFMKLEPIVKVGNVEAVASAIKAKLGGVIVEKMLESTISKVVEGCERRKKENLRRKNPTPKLEGGTGIQNRGSTVVSSLKKQTKLAGGKQLISTSGNVKGLKKLTIIKERVKTKIVKDLKTKTKSCMTNRAGRGTMPSLEEMRRRLPPGVTLSLSPASKPPGFKSRSNSFKPRTPTPEFRAPVASPRPLMPRMVAASPGVRWPGPCPRPVRGLSPRTSGVRSSKTPGVRMPGPKSHLLRGPISTISRVPSPKTPPAHSRIMPNSISTRPTTPNLSITRAAATMRVTNHIASSFSIAKSDETTPRKMAAPPRSHISSGLSVTVSSPSLVKTSKPSSPLTAAASILKPALNLSQVYPAVSLTKSTTPLPQIASSKIRAYTVRPVTPLPSMTKPVSPKTLVSKPPPRKPCPRPRGPQLVVTTQIPNQPAPVLKPRNTTSSEPKPGNLRLVQPNIAGLVRGSNLHPTRESLSMPPVLQYSKASSRNRQQVGTPVEFRVGLRVPPQNAVPTAGSAAKWNISVTSVKTLNNSKITKPGQPTPPLTSPTATARSAHHKPLHTSTPASVKLEPMELPQVWAQAGLVSNSVLSNDLNLGRVFVKREVLEEEAVLPAAGCKRLKLESSDLVAEQLLDYKDGSYLVKWVGLPKEQSTWEPADNLNCAQLVHQFHTSK